MNDRIDGFGEYLRYYHTYQVYKEINKWIMEKRRKMHLKA